MKSILSALLVVALTFAAFAEEWSASLLRSGDVLNISIFRAGEMDRSVRIEEDGTFVFPLCGTIEAAGKSTREVAKILESRLASQYADPHVDIFVTSWGPRTIYLLGEYKSGSMSLELPQFGRMTALQAISTAGGFTESADLANVAVLRRKKGSDEYIRIPVDVSVLLGNAGTSEEVLMYPEDTLLAPRAYKVAISGQVKNPCMISIETKRPPRLSELVVQAGGLSNGADIDNIVIVRQDGEGVRNTIIASLRADKPGEYKDDPIIQPGDHVIVTLAQKIYVAGAVQDAKGLDMPPESIITVSQAITLAGGFKSVASRSKVTVIRGTERIRVDLSNLYSKDGNLDKDITLQYGDIVFVPESFW